eukprot:gene37894-49665_t
MFNISYINGSSSSSYSSSFGSSSIVSSLRELPLNLTVSSSSSISSLSASTVASSVEIEEKLISDFCLKTAYSSSSLSLPFTKHLLQINSQSRTVVSTGYLEQMFRSQIIVTSNPSDWEGDFRLMEAMSSGALVFVDRMFVPRPYPLLEDLHVVYYDNNNKTELFEKLDAYRANSDHMATVAAGGYLHAMTYHRAACLIDYVLRTVHTLELTDGAVLSKSAAHSLKLERQSGSGSGVQNPYVYTGLQMRQL